MAESSSAVALNALDECIERFASERRTRIDAFIDRHFSIQETIELQKKSYHLDFLFNPINALWSIPYLSLRKSLETLDKMGWTKLNPALEFLPSGLKTGYQKEIEKLIANELIDCQALILDLHQHPKLGKLLKSQQIHIDESLIRAEISKEIEKYSSSQATISDLCGSFLTLLSGWIFFGDKSMGVLDLGNRIARTVARDRAASNFFLGKKLGHAFYGVFPPQPSLWQVVLATFLVGTLLTAISVSVSVMSDPLRKKLGLHKKKLHALIDNLEERLFLQLKKDFKKSLREGQDDRNTG